MVSVREAVREDAPVLGHIMSRSFWSAFFGFISEKTLKICAKEEDCAALMASLLDAGQMRFLLGSLDGRPCGELVWSDGETPEAAEIQAIHSLPESWGSGLGAAMLQQALADMRGLGKQSVSLWAFHENKRARRFYEKHGFAFTGQERVSEFDGAVEVRYVRELTEE